MAKRIIITGATGLIGRKTAEKLLLRGDRVIAVTRNAYAAKKALPSSAEILEWDYSKPDQTLIKAFNGTDAIIHLAGENVLSKKWTEEHKKKIYNSRIESTKAITAAILKSTTKPEVFICASAVGYYGLSTENPVNEYSNCGTDFLAFLTRDWENASSKLDNAGVRRVNIRTGIVLDKQEGALAK